MSSRWSPDDRLALIERLHAKSGDASESLFDAHDLGTAYRSAGDKNSKRARITRPCTLRISGAISMRCWMRSLSFSAMDGRGHAGD
jgi:hypothetical protein